jgi:allantoicase
MNPSTTASVTATFSGLVDLAAASLGGKALGTNDDFFAGIANLIQPGRGQFIEGKFTDRGKWMDGWESRRKRGPGHDWCVLELGAPGDVVGFDIDTHHFVGNHPPFASVDGIWAPPGPGGGAVALDQLLARGDWSELLEQAPLRPDAQNLFGAIPRGRVSHVRLNVFPDGGVARFRVFGRVHPAWDDRPVLDAETRRRVPSELRDLAAIRNGGVALACSDAFFGPMNNLLLPGRAQNMGGGWETRRRRGAGHDWILIKLGARGTVKVVEVDTQHFKGNYPDRCSIEVIDAPVARRITDLLERGAWRTILPEVALSADTQHFFDVEGEAAGPASHLRMNIFPDGGMSRLRVWGRRDV